MEPEKFKGLTLKSAIVLCESRNLIMRAAPGDFFIASHMPTRAHIFLDPGAYFGPALDVLYRRGWISLQLGCGRWANVGKYWFDSQADGSTRASYSYYASVLSAQQRTVLLRDYCSELRRQQSTMLAIEGAVTKKANVRVAACAVGRSWGLWARSWTRAISTHGSCTICAMGVVQLVQPKM